MARCWTCGAHTEYFLFTCPACRAVEQIQDLRREAADLQQRSFEQLSERLDELAEIQQRGFEELSDKLSEIATIIEWGFEEVSWQLQQQTDVLQSIDHTLKTPSETKANEYRQMAEELRRRGLLDDAKEYFLRALDLNPLDYRIHMGLAETYLQMDKCDQAKKYLEKSLPHAPDSARKSYSYRLIGHACACVEDYPNAVSALRSAIELSPAYHIALYDLAQYSAQARDKETCLSALRDAIAKDSFYFYLAQKERNFRPLSLEVGNLLKEIGTDASDRAKIEISKAEEMLRVAEELIVETCKVSKAYSGLEEPVLDSTTVFNSARSKLDSAKDRIALEDYRASLDTIPIAEEAHDLAGKAKNGLDDEYRHYRELLENVNPVRDAIMVIPVAAVWGAVGGVVGTVIGVILVIIAGCFAGIIVLFTGGGAFREIGSIGGKTGLIVGFSAGMIYGIAKLVSNLQRRQRIKQTKDIEV